MLNQSTKQIAPNSIPNSGIEVYTT